MDVSPRHVVFGSSVGSVYVFERRDERGRPREPGAGYDLAEGPAKFAERFMVENAENVSAMVPVVGVKVNPQGTRVAIAFDGGEVVVSQFNGAKPHGAKTPRGEERLLTSGRYDTGMPEAHKGSVLTTLAWNAAGDRLICGDENGAASIIFLAPEGKAARVVRFEHPIVQAGFLDHGDDTETDAAAIVSTTAQLHVVKRKAASEDDGSKFNLEAFAVGSKPRAGGFGGAAHARAKMGVPEGLDLAALDATSKSKSTSGSGSDAWFFGARPGRRLWLCRASTDDAGGFDATVVATLRPSVLDATPCPTSSTFTARVPKKWEFGKLLPLGPCVLSASDRALAVIDFVSATVLAWYPLEGRAAAGYMGGGDVMGSITALCAVGPRAFVLGSEGGVWCLQGPVDPEGVVHAAAGAAARANVVAAENDPGAVAGLTEDERALLIDEGYHVARIAARFGIEAPAARADVVAEEPATSAAETTTATAAAEAGGEDESFPVPASPERGAKSSPEAPDAAEEELAAAIAPVEIAAETTGASAAVEAPAAVVEEEKTPAAVAAKDEDDVGIITRRRNAEKNRKKKDKKKNKRVVRLEEPSPEAPAAAAPASPEKPPTPPVDVVAAPAPASSSSPEALDEEVAAINTTIAELSVKADAAAAAASATLAAPS